MTVTDELLANNDSYAGTFPGLLPMPSSRHVAVVACMDRRLNVLRRAGPARGRGATSSATPAGPSPTT